MFSLFLLFYTDLYTRFAEWDAESIGVLAVVFHKLLERSEGGASRDEETAFVQLPDPVVLHRIAISH